MMINHDDPLAELMALTAEWAGVAEIGQLSGASALEAVYHPRPGATHVLVSLTVQGLADRLERSGWPRPRRAAE